VCSSDLGKRSTSLPSPKGAGAAVVVAVVRDVVAQGAVVRVAASRRVTIPKVGSAGVAADRAAKVAARKLRLKPARQTTHSAG